MTMGHLFRALGSRHQYFLLSVQPLRTDALGAAVVNKPGGLRDGSGLRRVFNAHDVVEPRLLSHCIDIHFLTPEPIYEGYALLVVRAGESTRLVHCPGKFLCEKRPI